MDIIYVTCFWVLSHCNNVMMSLRHMFVMNCSHHKHGFILITNMIYFNHYFNYKISFFSISVNRFGPLMRSWCMRYEAKHHYFKRLAIVFGNFINVSYPLAKRHQEGVCYRLQSAKGGASSLIDKGVEIGPDMCLCKMCVLIFLQLYSFMTEV